jgi:hypothetical protein
MKHYVGERTPLGCEVDVIDSAAPNGGYALSPRQDLRNHSPTGFEWSYAGSGPAQLALALLADALGDDEKAQRLYQEFKFALVVRLPKDRWELSQEDILQTVARIAEQRFSSQDIPPRKAKGTHAWQHQCMVPLSQPRAIGRPYAPRLDLAGNLLAACQPAAIRHCLGSFLPTCCKCGWSLRGFCE